MLLRDGHAGPKVDYVMELLYIILLLGGVLMLLKLGGQDVALLLQLAYPAVYVSSVPSARAVIRLAIWSSSFAMAIL